MKNNSAHVDGRCFMLFILFSLIANYFCCSLRAARFCA